MSSGSVILSKHAMTMDNSNFVRAIGRSYKSPSAALFDNLDNCDDCTSKQSKKKSSKWISIRVAMDMIPEQPVLCISNGADELHKDGIEHILTTLKSDKRDTDQVGEVNLH